MKPTIRDLYPHLEDQELRQSEENLARYVRVVLEIHERTQWERNSPPRPGHLIDLDPGATLEGKGRTIKNNSSLSP